MKETLKIANFIINKLNQQHLPITSRTLGNLLYLIAGNYYLKYRQLLFKERFYRLGVGYQLNTLEQAFDTHTPRLKPTKTVTQLTANQSQFVTKQLTAIDNYSYNRLAYQCAQVHKKLAASKLKLSLLEK